MKEVYLVKRDDNGRVWRVQLEDTMQIYDLLEASKKSLNFNEDAILTAHDENDNVIKPETLLNDPNLKDLTILVIKNVQQDDKENQLNMRKDEQNLRDATELRKTIDCEVKKNNVVNDELKGKIIQALEENFQNCGTCNNSSEKLMETVSNLVNNNSNCNNNSADRNMSIEKVSDTDLIKFLTDKLSVECLGPGFIYEIDNKRFCDLDESDYKEHSFSSEAERKVAESQVYSTSDWSSWKLEGGLSGWGVLSISASGSQNKATIRQSGNKTKENAKSCTAIVTKTLFYQLKKFGVKIQLNDIAIRDAKALLNTKTEEDKATAINSFFEKYCIYVYAGMFSAGGWYRTVATATSDEEVDVSVLLKAASDKAENHIASAANLDYVKVGGGGGRRRAKSLESEHCTNSQTNNSSVDVRIKKVSAPGNTFSEADLEVKLREDVKNWTVFPSTKAKKNDFMPLHEIIRNQAVDMKDLELHLVSDLLKSHMQEQTQKMENGNSKRAENLTNPLPELFKRKREKGESSKAFVTPPKYIDNDGSFIRLWYTAPSTCYSDSGSSSLSPRSRRQKAKPRAPHGRRLF